VELKWWNELHLKTSHPGMEKFRGGMTPPEHHHRLAAHPPGQAAAVAYPFGETMKSVGVWVTSKPASSHAPFLVQPFHFTRKPGSSSRARVSPAVRAILYMDEETALRRWFSTSTTCPSWIMLTRTGFKMRGSIPE